MQHTGFLFRGLLLPWSTDSRRAGFLSHGAQALERMGFVAPRQVESEFPEQGLNPCPPPVAGGSLTTGPPSKSQALAPFNLITSLCLSFFHGKLELGKFHRRQLPRCLLRNSQTEKWQGRQAFRANNRTASAEIRRGGPGARGVSGSWKEACAAENQACQAPGRGASCLGPAGRERGVNTPIMATTYVHSTNLSLGLSPWEAGRTKSI